MEPAKKRSSEVGGAVLVESDFVDIKHLEAYYAAKGARINCPFCDCVDWSVNGEENSDAAWIVAPPLLTPTFPHTARASLPAILMTCQNCGFVRMQAIRPILAWKAEQSEK